MRTHRDQLTKRALGELLVLVGEVRREHEIVANARRIDVAFEPRRGRAREAMRRRLGLLGDIAATPCFIEAFSRTPDLDAIYACADKALGDPRRRRRRRRGDGSEDSGQARVLWVLSPGRPERALRVFAMRTLPGFPAGVYGVTGEFPLRIVVVDELPRVRHTLLVRMFGGDRARVEALREAWALEDGSVERRVARSIVLSWHRALRSAPRRTRKEQEIVTLLEELEAHEERIRRAALRRGRQAGIAEGVAKTLREMFARRLGRPLSRAELRTLDLRIEALGQSAIADLILSRTPARLAAWLAAPASR